MELIESLYSESNPKVIYPEDEATKNVATFAFTQGGSKADGTGRIDGCTVTMTSSGVFTISQGTVMVGGYRLRVEETETLLDLSQSASPSSTTSYKLVVRVTRSGHDASFDVLAITGSLSSDEIWREDGTLDLCLGSFRWSSNGQFSNYNNSASTLKAWGGGSSSQSLGMSVPTPVIQLAGYPGGNGYGFLNLPLILLANVQDYASLASRYTVVFRVMRFTRINRSRRAKISASTKRHYPKKGWFAPTAFGGPGNCGSGLGIPVSVNVNELKTRMLCDGKNATNVLLECGLIAVYMFGVKDSGRWITFDDDDSITMAKIRTSGSRQKRRHVAGNSVTIGFKAQIYSGSTLVGESAISSAIRVKPDPHAVAKDYPMKSRERCFVAEVLA